MGAVLTLFLELRSAPLLINIAATSLRVFIAAIYKGVLPYYKPWVRFINNNNNH